MSTNDDKDFNDEDFIIIYRPYVTNRHTGKRIYRKDGGMFRIRVRRDS